jgi:CheY-like chemotaxis protein
MLNVLLVEDEPHAREFIIEALTDAGHSVHGVQNGEVALVILEEGVHFDLLITDIMLPWGIDGLELVNRARRIRPALRFLYITGLAGFSRRDLSALHGPLITKPMRLAQLLAAVESAAAGAVGMTSGMGTARGGGGGGPELTLDGVGMALRPRGIASFI